MRQLRETRQHWRDRKKLTRTEHEMVRAAHRRVVALLEAGVTVVNEMKLPGAWDRYSCVEIGNDWLLIYRVEQDQVLLVRVATRDEIFA